jgi:hypothetical protein
VAAIAQYRAGSSPPGVGASDSDEPASDDGLGRAPTARAG